MLFVRPAFAIGRLFWKRGDEGTIDRFGPNGLAAVIAGGSRVAGRLQSGYVYTYAFVMLIGLTAAVTWAIRSEEHTSELQSLMRHSYAVFCLKKKNKNNPKNRIITKISIKLIEEDIRNTLQLIIQTKQHHNIQWWLYEGTTQTPRSV